MDPTRSHDASKNREEDHILRMATDLARLSAELDGLSPRSAAPIAWRSRTRNTRSTGPPWPWANS